MRHAVVERPGRDGAVVIVDGSAPVPAPGEVVVEAEAAGLAFADVLMCAGAYPGTPREGFTPGYDVVGRIVAVGDAAGGDWAVGDRVAALLVRGGLAERVAVPADRLVLVPEGVDAARAACLPLNYVTAHQLLHRVAKVRSGGTVLVFGAGGGVGSALCELAGLHGCRVVGVAAQAKHERVAALGAVPVASRTPDVADRIAAAAGGRGIDVAFDPVGGAQLALAWRSLAPGGHLVCYGFSGAMFGQGSAAGVFLASQLRMAWWRMTGRGRRISFYSIADRMAKLPGEYAEDLATLLGLLENDKITPAVDTTVPLDGVPEAYRRLRAGTVCGKVVAVPAPAAGR